MKKILFCVALFLFLVPRTWAQILDDSTKQVYSAKTTLYFQESDLKLRPVDTTLTNIHHYTASQRTRYLSQDLGVFCTPVRPLFYQSPSRIGTRLGLDTYSLYAFSSAEMRYFDTKSPFLQARYVQGILGDQSIDIFFTRSIKKAWNIGLHYVRENSNRQYGTTSPRDPQADLIRFCAPVRYEGKKKRYLALFHFSTLNHQGHETGGATSAAGKTNDSIFIPRFSQAILKSTPRSWQTQNTLYLYQQYRVDSAFTVFTRWKAYWQRDNYTERDTSNHAFYPIENFEPSVRYYYRYPNIGEDIRYRDYAQESGIKGKWKGFVYEAFLRSRYFVYSSSHDGDSLQTPRNGGFVNYTVVDFPRVSRTEVFLEGSLAYQTRKGYGVRLGAAYQPTGDYVLHGEWRTKIFKVAGKSMLYSPALVEQRMLSNFVFWNNVFRRTLSNEVMGEAELAGKGWSFQPAFRYVLLTNYIYQTRLTPMQETGILQLIQPSLRFAGQARRIHFNSQTHYTLRTGADVLRLPALTGFGQVYCEDCFFRKKMQSQIGIEWQYRSAYLADAYAPYTKLFYLQDTLEVPAYIVADVFFNFRIKNLRGFFKLGYANQLPNSGYLVAPVYPAMRRQLTFGFDWMFFD